MFDFVFVFYLCNSCICCAEKLSTWIIKELELKIHWFYEVPGLRQCQTAPTLLSATMDIAGY